MSKSKKPRILPGYDVKGGDYIIHDNRAREVFDARPGASTVEVRLIPLGGRGSLDVIKIRLHGTIRILDREEAEAHEAAVAAERSRS